MKISYKGDYALKAMLLLSIRYNEDPESVVSITEIAKLGDMPTNFLEQILLTLRRGGFVKSRRGTRGGFSLAKRPKDITVGDVVRFVEGPIEPIACVGDKHYKGCKDLTGCIFRNVWQEVKEAISTVIDTLTFEELLVRYKEKDLGLSVGFNYVI